MDYLVVCSVALVASGLTLISGFGLGTLLLPAFAVFFPIPIAVAMTAIVHLANNVFKMGLVGFKADRRLVLRFGLPAMACALLGAWLLQRLSTLEPVAEYEFAGALRHVKPVTLVVALLMAAFAVVELVPGFGRASVHERWLPFGGALSGFFGGLSGHQGALRSTFLLRFKESLTPESFIATGVVIAILVDVGRIAVYAAVGQSLAWSVAADHAGIVAAATGTAFLGAWIGSRLIKKLTLRAVQIVVGVLLFLLSIALGAGLMD